MIHAGVGDDRDFAEVEIFQRLDRRQRLQSNVGDLSTSQSELSKLGNDAMTLQDSSSANVPRRYSSSRFVSGFKAGKPRC